MKQAALLALTLVAACGNAATPDTRIDGDLELERVVMVMRHGVRPPTKAKVVPEGYTQDPWPNWPVDFGLLTPHGAKGAELLGESDRIYFADRGLLAPGCPATGAVVLKASGKQRAIRTAESWATGFMPGCAAQVAHPVNDADDPIFHGLDGAPQWFDGKYARAEAIAQSPGGDLDGETRAHADELALLAKVLGCGGSSCPITTEPSRLVASPHDRPDLEGPLDVASTASQTFLLEYLEGMPMAQVGWGRVTRPEIERLLRFHPLKFKYSNRPDYVARAAAAPLASEIATALGPKGAKLTLLAGHDTNIADLGGFFALHWHVPSYPADEIPPGSALGFEVVRNQANQHYVRAFFRAQTMDQLRELQSLAQDRSAYRTYLPIPGCGNSLAATACTLDDFMALIASRQPTGHAT